MSAAQIIVTVFALYVAAGLCVAAAFVAKGVEQVSHHMTFTLGARLVLFPGAVPTGTYVPVLVVEDLTTSKPVSLLLTSLQLSTILL